MTLIAFATYGDRAEIITDTATYSLNGSNLGRTSKVVTVPHLDMAVMTQGDSMFGTDGKTAVLQAARQVTTFDELVDVLPDVLRDLWAHRRREWINAADTLVFLIGYSPRAGRFVAWGCATDLRNLEPFPIEQPWVMPCPYDVQPDDLQAARFLAADAEWAAAWDAEPTGPAAVASWIKRPPLSAPASVEEWIELAIEVRRQRALEDDFLKTFVAGDVHHTRIERGSCSTERIHTFDDTGAELLQMVSGTTHPFAQVMACWCGSRERFIDCHLAPALDEPCDCKSSDKALRECCAADVLSLPPPPRSTADRRGLVARYGRMI